VAHGRRRPYRYYTCFSRNRYGRHGCQADRLPADALEQAVLDSMQATYSDTGLIGCAIREARRRAESSQPGLRSNLRKVQARIAKAEAALERYYDAFESGELNTSRFSGRIELLERKLADLRGERDELTERLENESLVPGADVLSQVRMTIADGLAAGTPVQRKALLQELVSEIRVESRTEILPTYRLPTARVRVMPGGLVDPRVCEFRT